ncbi:DUF4158 domain-containing protein [Sinorhizobium meliloti]|uniref:DUF4158 domain-containing protein n=1 Tax=Rhizobium meliloti TaxID=382 RepID=UPI001F2EBDC6|nr:DUF4158 domain-containing protein [Sinorhizobium meliloti]
MPARISMTGPQRDALLGAARHRGDGRSPSQSGRKRLAGINSARTPETRLGYALQLCCLRYPGRHLRRGELLPAVMLDHIAEQIGADAEVIAGFARRTPTRCDQLLAIKARFGFADLTKPMRATLRAWLEAEAVSLTDGRVLLDKFLDELRARKIVIPASPWSKAWQPRRCMQPKPGSSPISTTV